MKHGLVVVIVLTIAYFLGVSALAYGIIAGVLVGYFIGREYGAAEYEAITQFYGNRRANMPFLAPILDSEVRAVVWDKKDIMDWLVPTVFAAIMVVGRLII